MIHETALLVGFENMQIGSNVRIDAYCLLSGPISIGNHVHVGAQVCAFGEVILGDFTGVSHGSKLYAKTDDFSGATLTNPTVPGVAVIEAPIHLGRHAIIGSTCVVLAGVTIGEGSVVGALSLVNRSLEPWGVYVGSPARRVKDRKRDVLELEARLKSSDPMP